MLTNADGDVAPLELELRLCGPHAHGLEPDHIFTSDKEWKAFVADAFLSKNLPEPIREKSRIVISRV
jgi:hypothetical protein